MKKSIKILSVMLLAALALSLLVACTPVPNADSSKALENLKDNGYTAAQDTTIVPTALRLLGVNGISSVIKGSKTVTTDDGNKYETVTIVYFTSNDAAKTAWETVKEYAEDKNDDKDEDSDWIVNISGSMIYYGTTAAIKAAK